jgi:hypothetical protein
MKFSPFANLRETAFQLLCEIARREFPDNDLEELELDKEYFIYAMDGKWYAYYNINWNYGTFFDLISKELLWMAGDYLDPDKAYDLVNYPDLENWRDGWTKERLKEKLGDKFLEFSPFVPKWQYLVFMCEVFKLCHVKRFSAEYRHLYRSAVENSTEIKSALKAESFTESSRGSGQGIDFSRDELDDDCFLSQSRYSDMTSDFGKSEYKLYAYVTKGSYETFDTFGAVDVDGKPLKENAWNCVPNNIYFDKSRIDDLPIPAHGTSYSMGFTFKKCIAVCDYSAHFNVDDR